MVEIKVDVPVDRLVEYLNKVLGSLDTTGILDEAGAFLLNRIRDRFLREQDPGGTPWKPSLAAIKRRSAGGSGTLFASGRLFRSIQVTGSGPSQRQIGTDVGYGLYHQTGTKRMPQRMFLGFNDQDADLLETILLDRLEKALS